MTRASGASARARPAAEATAVAVAAVVAAAVDVAAEGLHPETAAAAAAVRTAVPGLRETPPRAPAVRVCGGGGESREKAYEPLAPHDVPHDSSCELRLELSEPLPEPGEPAWAGRAVPAPAAAAEVRPGEKREPVGGRRRLPSVPGEAGEPLEPPDPGEPPPPGEPGIAAIPRGAVVVVAMGGAGGARVRSAASSAASGGAGAARGAPRSAGVTTGLSVEGRPPVPVPSVGAPEAAGPRV